MHSYKARTRTRPRTSTSTQRASVGAAPQSSKMYLSPGHMTERLGTTGPDPGTYRLPGSLGSQPSSPKRSNPQYSLYR